MFLMHEWFFFLFAVHPYLYPHQTGVQGLPSWIGRLRLFAHVRYRGHENKGKAQNYLMLC